MSDLGEKMLGLTRKLVARVINGGDSSLFTQNDGTLRSQYIYTIYTPAQGPRASTGFSVGFKIKPNEDGTFEIHKAQNGFYADFTPTSKTLSFKNTAGGQKTELLETVNSLEKAKDICLVAFSNHKAAQIKEQQSRKDIHIGVTVGDTVRPREMTLNY